MNCWAKAKLIIENYISYPDNWNTGAWLIACGLGDHYFAENKNTLNLAAEPVRTWSKYGKLKLCEL